MTQIETNQRWRWSLLLAALVLASPATTVAEKSACQKAEVLVAQSPGATRMAAVRTWLDAECPTVPATLWSAVDTGKWADGITVIPPDRAFLLSALSEAGHERAQKQIVSMLEMGKWANGDELAPRHGAELIGSLRSSLDKYRTRLLLDIYDQIRLPQVQGAVVQTLGGAEFPEARVPVLDAYWGGDKELRGLAAASLALWSEDSAEKQLISTVQSLEAGPVLQWASRLARENGVKAAVDAAAKKESGD